MAKETRIISRKKLTALGTMAISAMTDEEINKL
jgi:hypothetical protein